MVPVCLMYTVEPPNKGHVGTRSFVLYREVSFIRRLKCTGIGTSRFVLYREVFFIRSVLYRRFHCIWMFYHIFIQEYPFYTISTLPEGVLTHIGGLVTARSVKLLDKINNPGIVTYCCIHIHLSKILLSSLF